MLHERSDTRMLIVAAIIERQGRILICQRARHVPQPLKWEFPGGKVESGEDERTALVRELAEELEIDAAIGRLLTRIRHSYSGIGDLELAFYSVDHYTGEAVNRVFEQIRWVTRRELPDYDFLAADVPLVRELARSAD